MRDPRSSSRMNSSHGGIWDLSAVEYCQSLNQSTIDELKIWDSKWTSKMIPFHIYFVIIIVLGVAGNSVVVYIYGRKPRKNTGIQFILFLAVVDLIVCLVITPMALHDIYKKFTFFNELACGFYEFLRHLSLAVSCICLGCIAIDRYFAICRPLSFFMHRNRARYMMACSVLLGCILEISVFFLFGLNRVVLPDGLVGCECQWKERYVGTHVYLIFQICQLILQLSLGVMIIVLYALVYQVVHRREKQRQNGNELGVRSSADVAKYQQDPKQFGNFSPEEANADKERHDSIVAEAHNQNISQQPLEAALGSVTEQGFYESQIGVQEQENTQSSAGWQAAKDDEENIDAHYHMGNLSKNEAEHDANADYHSREAINCDLDSANKSNPNHEEGIEDKTVTPTERTMSEKDRENNDSVKPSSSEQFEHLSTSDQRQKVSGVSQPKVSLNNTSVDQFPALKDQEQHSGTRDNDSIVTLDKQRVHPVRRPSSIDQPSRPPSTKSNARRGSSGPRGRYKTAQMLVLVTVVFFLSWIPYWIITLVVFVDPDFYQEKQFWELNVIKILRHLYFVNNATNPIIYTFINKQFRQEVKAILSCKFCCTCGQCKSH